jgi:hypothetical protein
MFGLELLGLAAATGIGVNAAAHDMGIGSYQMDA